MARDDPKQGKLRALGLSTLGLKAWVLAAFSPVAVHGVGAVALAATGIATFSMASIAAGPIDFVMNLLINTVLGLILALTEEVGWRGYILPRFLDIGPVRAMLLVGFLHAVWHLPLLAGTDLYHGLGQPMITIPLFMVTLTLAGVFYGVLRLWSGSLWPVVIAHAAANAGWNVAAGMQQAPSLWASEYLGGESGLIMIVGLLLIDLGLIWAIRHQKLILQPKLTD